MKIVVASDTFKGSLSSKKINEINHRVLKKFYENLEYEAIPMADGGEGTVESIVEALNGELIKVEVNNPLKEMIIAEYGLCNNIAIIEMASASGINTVSDHNRNILMQNTYGTGELIIDALNRNVTDIFIGIGGSATNDCGIGFCEALGVRFYDDENNLIEAIPNNFNQIKHIDISNVDKRLANVNITIMSDVKNPLLGPSGSTYIYGPQKGADPKQLEFLENGMKNYISIAEQTLNKSVKEIEGSGAAGGLGAALLLFTNSKMRSGIDTIMEIVDLKNKIKSADLVITGEGRIDEQSAFGKVCYGVGNACKEESIPCIAIVGSVGTNAEAMYEHGITSIVSIVDKIMTLDEAISNAEELYEKALINTIRIIKVNK